MHLKAECLYYDFRLISMEPARTCWAAGIRIRCAQSKRDTICIAYVWNNTQIEFLHRLLHFLLALRFCGLRMLFDVSFITKTECYYFVEHSKQSQTYVNALTCVCARVFLCLKASQPKFFGFQLNLFDFKRVFNELTFLMDLIDSNSIFHVHREYSILCRLHTFQIDTKTASVFLFNSKLDTFVPFELWRLHLIAVLTYNRYEWVVCQ